jgi:hypothetical protein
MIISHPYIFLFSFFNVMLDDHTIKFFFSMDLCMNNKSRFKEDNIRRVHTSIVNYAQTSKACLTIQE